METKVVEVAETTVDTQGAEGAAAAEPMSLLNFKQAGRLARIVSSSTRILNRCVIPTRIFGSFLFAAPAIFWGIATQRPIERTSDRQFSWPSRCADLHPSSCPCCALCLTPSLSQLQNGN